MEIWACKNSYFRVWHFLDVIYTLYVLHPFLSCGSRVWSSQCSSEKDNSVLTSTVVVYPWGQLLVPKIRRKRRGERKKGKDLSFLHYCRDKPVTKHSLWEGGVYLSSQATLHWWDKARAGPRGRHWSREHGIAMLADLPWFALVLLLYSPGQAVQRRHQWAGSSYNH